MIFNSDLVDDLAREKVVLFLGAGVSASAVTAAGGKISDWGSFLDKSCEHVSEKVGSQVKGLLEKKDFLLACEILQGALADTWEDYVKAEFGQKATPSALHNSIINLGQRLILTTNFDKLLETAWEAIDAKATHYPTVLSSLNEDVFRALKDHSGKYLVKIHGTVDDAKSLVFSRSEYIRLAFGNSSYSGFLENLLLNYTFLFVGFSMDDPAITSLMEMYAFRYPAARPHYIFASEDIPENILDINKRLRKLIYMSYKGHENLPPLIDKLGEAARERRKQILAASLV